MDSTVEADGYGVDGNGVDGNAVDGNGVDLAEAARQLEQATHDARVAFDCIGLEEFDRAHTHTLMARAAVDAAENALRVALGGARNSAAS